MGINATFGHRAKVYFTCIKPLVWSITVPSMNKINPFFFDISQQTHKIYEIIDHDYSNLPQSQIICYVHQWLIVTIMVSNMKKFQLKNASCEKVQENIIM